MEIKCPRAKTHVAWTLADQVPAQHVAQVQPMSSLCEFCERPVDTAHKDTFKQVRVWVGGPKKNSAKLSEETGLVAHERCVRDAGRGVAPDQPPIEFA